MSDSTILPGGPRAERTRTGKGVGFGRSVAFSAARGAALIGIAVIIGIVLLQVIDDGTSGPDRRRRLRVARVAPRTPPRGPALGLELDDHDHDRGDAR